MQSSVTVEPQSGVVRPLNLPETEFEQGVRLNFELPVMAAKVQDTVAVGFGDGTIELFAPTGSHSR